MMPRVPHRVKRSRDRTTQSQLTRRAGDLPDSGDPTFDVVSMFDATSTLDAALAFDLVPALDLVPFSALISAFGLTMRTIARSIRRMPAARRGVSVSFQTMQAKAIVRMRPPLAIRSVRDMEPWRKASLPTICSAATKTPKTMESLRVSDETGCMPPKTARTMADTKRTTIE